MVGTTIRATVSHTAIHLTVHPHEDSKWNGYDMSVRTEEGIEVTIKGASIWGLDTWVEAIGVFLDDGVQDKVAEMIAHYPR